MVLAVSIGTSSVAQGVGLLVGAAANIQVSSVTIFFILKRLNGIVLHWKEECLAQW